MCLQVEIFKADLNLQPVCTVFWTDYRNDGTFMSNVGGILVAIESSVVSSTAEMTVKINDDSKLFIVCSVNIQCINSL